MKIKKYKSVYHCKSCDEELTYNEVYYNKGVCPYCGNVSGSTITAYVVKSSKNTNMVDKQTNPYETIENILAFFVFAVPIFLAGVFFKAYFIGC
jgi:predicted RNA-binding Zn-ribbon protein involved in translation (DUF1610 family)